jgi:hypothetical protein
MGVMGWAGQGSSIWAAVFARRWHCDSLLACSYNVDYEGGMCSSWPLPVGGMCPSILALSKKEVSGHKRSC